jgi:rhamnogalacturonyl hydrolase YesR
MLWSDFISQVPPTFAYYGVATNNASLVQQAVTQITLYREILQDPSTGLWKHIAGSRSDLGTWNTGNGWAAYGIVRVLATIVHWSTSPTDLSSQRALLTRYAGEIIDGAIAADPGTQLLRNYITEPSSFREASGTALIAAALYRLAVLAPCTYGTAKYLEWADSKRAAVAAAVGSDGVLAPVANPYAYAQTTPYDDASPEGQSFAVYLYSAYRDCICAGVCKAA